jgi:predicted dehydrogenase
MRQILQDVGGGAIVVRETPDPICGTREVLIATQASLVSAGTERTVLDLARRSLLGKARERPDHVRRLLRKAREEGVLETIRQARTKLSEPMAIGYSAAGVVLETGRDVRRFRVGEAVAAAGAHAEITVVPHNLVAKVPAGVPFADAAYGVVGSIALHAVRLARVGLGDRVAVIGLGLVGQLVTRLLVGSGCRVFGTDPNGERRALAQETGAGVSSAESLAGQVQEATDGRGADAVIIAAATPSNEPLELAAAVAQKRARIVAVGAVGLNVPRREFYEKELELVVSSSYGPGRYDPDYERRGEDYPAAYVRWTSQRNIEAVLEQIAARTLDVRSLTTHTFAIEDAAQAYELLGRGDGSSLGIVLTYPEAPIALRPSPTVQLRLPVRSSARPEVGVGFIGAGNFASVVLLPRLAKTEGVRLRSITSAKGVTAAARGSRHGFEQAVSAPEDVISRDGIDAVFIATRHDHHADLALSALRHGKAVFVEKPLAITREALRAFEDGVVELGDRVPLWMVDFNRRFSASARMVSEFFATVSGPRTLQYRFNAGAVPAEHWTQDPEIGGGRLVGEACHALDLTCFLLDAQITRVFAECATRAGGIAEDESVVILRMDDGSVATLMYSVGGDRGLPKERIEVLGGGRMAVIDDFDSVTLSAEGRSQIRKSAREKGHAAAVDAFLSAVRTGGPPPIPHGTLLNVSWATLAMVESLHTGLPVEVETYRPVEG